MRVKKEKSQQQKHVTITPFREKVYEYVKTIPKGKVSTYGDVAKSVNSCARAVGQAMRHNPFAPEVPWHRVIAADRQLGGFSGQWGKEQPNVKRKFALLEQEGVKFDNNGRVVMECMYKYKKVKLTGGKKNKGNSESKDKMNKERKKVEMIQRKIIITQKMLEQEIVGLLKKRAKGKTCWPSEIPRSIVKKQKYMNLKWREYMDPVRQASRSLVRKGILNVLQKGKVLDTEEQYRGPIRLQLK